MNKILIALGIGVATIGAIVGSIIYKKKQDEKKNADTESAGATQSSIAADTDPDTETPIDDTGLYDGTHDDDENLTSVVASPDPDLTDLKYEGRSKFVRSRRSNNTSNSNSNSDTTIVVIPPTPPAVLDWDGQQVDPDAILQADF